MLVQSGLSLLHAEPVPFQNCDDEGGCCWEMMMDTRFSNLNGVGDVGITEGGEASLHQESMGNIHDPFCCVAAHVVSDYLLVGLVAKILGNILRTGLVSIRA